MSTQMDRKTMSLEERRAAVIVLNDQLLRAWEHAHEMEILRAVSAVEEMAHPEYEEVSESFAKGYSDWKLRVIELTEQIAAIEVNWEIRRALPSDAAYRYLEAFYDFRNTTKLERIDTPHFMQQYEVAGIEPQVFDPDNLSPFAPSPDTVRLSFDIFSFPGDRRERYFAYDAKQNTLYEQVFPRAR